jgi:hypothetical protein
LASIPWKCSKWHHEAAENKHSPKIFAQH